MLTLIAVLLLLWVVGLVTATTLGGFIHLLLLAALILVLVLAIQGRRPF